MLETRSSVVTIHHPPVDFGSGNTLLASLPLEDYRRLVPHLRSVRLTKKQVLLKQGDSIRQVVFPGGGAYSFIKMMEDGKSTEIATIGNEGAIGTLGFLGQEDAGSECVVQVPASADVLPIAVFRAEIERRGGLFDRVSRYNEALTRQIVQTTACNALHSLQQRFCRWLLVTQDRVEREEFPVTQDAIAAALGVRRPSVTLVALALQHDRAIHCRRGHITIVDREALEAAACECYRAAKVSFERVVGRQRLTGRL